MCIHRLNCLLESSYQCLKISFYKSLLYHMTLRLGVKLRHAIITTSGVQIFGTCYEGHNNTMTKLYITFSQK